MRFTHLIFTSPHKKDAKIQFGAGLNLIYGPSNTGKSSIFDAIDFMFGRSRKLKEIKEHEGYESILLGIEFLDGQKFTLCRSLSGGDIKCFEGLHQSTTADQEFTLLRQKEKTKKHNSLPDFILDIIGLAEKRLKKNEKNQTDRLTLRNMLPLIFVNETDIQKEGSPYVGEQYTKKTVDRSRLKLFLTGVDDSALIPQEQERQRLSRQARLELLSEFIHEQKEKIAAVVEEGDTIDDLEDQVSKIHGSLDRELELLKSTEFEYRSCVQNRNRVRDEISAQSQRVVEIDEMLGRFQLLKEQYKSDVLRLENIIEAGSLFGGLPFAKQCPVCGSDLQDRDGHDQCEINPSRTIDAATAEIKKITLLNNELDNVMSSLENENEQIQSILPNIRSQLAESEKQISKINPLVIESQSKYSELLTAKSDVEKTIDLFRGLSELEARRKHLEEDAPDAKSTDGQDIQLPTNALFELSKRVSGFIKNWGMLDDPQSHYDKETDDFVIGGKVRTSNGKGHRAITHAAATLALMRFCEDKNLPFPGIILLDSPLLAYEKPENEQDDLSGTDVNLKFFKDLQKWDTRQIIIIENKKSIPPEYYEGDQIIHFTKSDKIGRYGFFPREN